MRENIKWEEWVKQDLNWLWELLLPTVFILVLIGCLSDMATRAFQVQRQPVYGFYYTISAVAN